MENQSKENKSRRKTTKPQEWQSFSNATDIKVEDIPADVLDDIAQLFYNVFTRMEAEKADKPTTDKENT